MLKTNQPISEPGRRFIPEPEFQQWMEDYSRAQTSMQEQMLVTGVIGWKQRKQAGHLCPERTEKVPWRRWPARLRGTVRYGWKDWTWSSYHSYNDSEANKTAVRPTISIKQIHIDHRYRYRYIYNWWAFFSHGPPFSVLVFGLTPQVLENPWNHRYRG